MALPEGALTATVTVGGSVGIAGTSAVVSDFTVALDLPAAGKQSPGLVWAATGEAINSFAETGTAGAITVLADQPGVLASSMAHGSPVLVEVRGWPLVARWRVTSGGARSMEMRRFAAPTPGATVDVDMLPRQGVVAPGTVTYAQTITVGDLPGHAADTTAVHGIADTSALVVTTDARLSDARTPLAHSHTLADVTDAGDAAGLDVGTTAGTVMAGDDSRVTSLPSTYVTTTTPQTITGVKTLTAPVLVATIPEAVFGDDLAPAMSAWTLAGGATWADPNLTIPAGGTISTTITVGSGAIYHVDLTKTATGGSGVQVQLGSVVVQMSSHATAPIPIQSSGAGAQTLTIGGGTWTATLQDVVVRKVTPAGPVAVPGSSDLRSAGSNNNAMGASAQRSLTTGGYNNVMGHSAQRSLTTGSYNNAMGHSAQRSLTTGGYNNVMGYYAQYNLTTGSYNNAMGHSAQYSLTTGGYNNAMGASAQYALTTGSYNNAMGYYAQYNLTTGSYNNAMGYYAQYNLTTGSYNNAMGHSAQRSPGGNQAWATTSGQRQTSVGHESGQGSAVQVNDIVTIGYRAISAGDKGVALGSTASAAHEGSVALGYGTTTSTTDQVAVGPRDIEIQASDHGVILTSPDASRWRATIGNAGALTWTKL